MNTELRKKWFGKGFFKLVSNAFLMKTLANIRKNRYIKLVTTEARSNYLASKPSYHTTFFFRIFISNRNEKTQNTCTHEEGDISNVHDIRNIFQSIFCILYIYI